MASKSKINFIAGFTLGLSLIPLFVFIYVKSGLMPVTTEDPSMPFEKFIAKSAIRAAIKKEEGLKPTLVMTETELKNGAHLYLNHCAGCHGLSDTPDSKMAEAMFPRSPQLFKSGDLITDDPVGKIHWKIKNGLRLTGMPAFKNILTDTEIWEISSLLHEADHLSPQVRAAFH